VRSSPPHPQLRCDLSREAVEGNLSAAQTKRSAHFIFCPLPNRRGSTFLSSFQNGRGPTFLSPQTGKDPYSYPPKDPYFYLPNRKRSIFLSPKQERIHILISQTGKDPYSYPLKQERIHILIPSNRKGSIFLSPKQERIHILIPQTGKDPYSYPLKRERIHILIPSPTCGRGLG